MSNRWEAFQDDNDEEIYITKNPIRKIKKKIRKKRERYKKKPSPELYNEISKLEILLEKFTTSSSPKPKKKKKKKKFKKIKVNKAEIAAEKRRKRDKEMLDRYNSNYKEEKRRFEKEQEKANFERINKLKKLHTHIYLPKDIRSWLSAPTKKGYYMLMKKYHPDKNNNNDNEYVKIITSQWDKVKK